MCSNIDIILSSTMNISWEVQCDGLKRRRNFSQIFHMFMYMSFDPKI